MQERPREKRWRDAACLICGLVMIGSVLWSASSTITHAPILIPEAIAIFAFATSWLVKGEAYQPVLSAMRQLRSKISYIAAAIGCFRTAIPGRINSVPWITEAREAQSPRLRTARFKFQKRNQLFLRTHDKTLSVVAMRVCNPDCSPVGINR